MISPKQFAEWSEAEILQLNYEPSVAQIYIDSRRIHDPQQALFVSIKTERRDGQNFIAQAYQKGVRQFLIHEPIAVAAYPDANFFLAKNTILALQKAMIRYRQEFQIPVIGVTGSNGKTIIKEWLFEMLSTDKNVLRNPKSYNSQIGVPISIALLRPFHETAIFEAGISTTGEMVNLEKLIRPDIGIFTNIGHAHSEGFINNQQKIKEKLLLFKHSQTLIYCSDYEELHRCAKNFQTDLRQTQNHELRLLTWSAKNEADLQILDVNLQDNCSIISARFEERTLSLTIPFSDKAYLENAIHCWLFLLQHGVRDEDIQLLISKLHPVAMRLELRPALNDSTLINDAYNSDLTGLTIALDFLNQQKQHHFHTIILSDLYQTGLPENQLYKEVAQLIEKNGIQRFIGVGSALMQHRLLFEKIKDLQTLFFNSTQDLLSVIHELIFDREAILLKGARTFQFEKISKILEQKIHQTILRVNLSALKNNLNVYREQLKPGVQTMAMVKAFSYGSGSFEIAATLQYAGIDYLAVAYTDEGVALRRAGITVPIMVMSPEMTSYDRMIKWNLEPEIYDRDSLMAFLQTALVQKLNHYPIHLKLDTGMHRLGFESDDLEWITLQLISQNTVKVKTIFSHLAASEDPTLDHFTQSQAERFSSMSETLVRQLGYKPLLHISNSAAISSHPELQMDMVRLGIGLYGIDSTGKLSAKLQHIGTLTTRIAQIKTVTAGETIGYGRKGNVDNTSKIATINIGYADGFPRKMGNGVAHVLIHGHHAATIGVICMDLCMVDVSEIPDAKVGDEVTVMNADLPVSQLAQWAETIPYEIMTGISQRVKRIYENEN